jgi:phage baseplate assembly protein W
MANESLKITRLYKDLDLSFTANPVTGDVSKKIDVNAVKQSLNILMQTNFYERPFEPEKGANLRGYLFEPMSSLTAGLIQNTIEKIIENYEPRVKIDTITVTANLDTNSYDVELRYFVIGIDRTQILTANLKRLR